MSINNKSSNIAFQKHDHRLCQRQLLSAARRVCELRKLRLTSRRRQVLEILLASHQPLGAYDILLAEGLVHRIESRNAFIGCVHPGHRSAAQFLICRGCEQVAELENPDTGLLAQADDLGFAVDHSVVEITGVCAECQKG